MNLIDKLEKKLSFLTIPNLTLSLIIGQIIAYLLISSNQLFANAIVFVPLAVYQGEWWRILSFLFYPPMSMHPIFLFFAWYFFYFIGKSIETAWGDFRYTLFILIGWLATIVVALIAPFLFGSYLALFPISNAFLATTLFLAFARFNPDYQILFMLIIPIKIKWLAWFTWGSLAISFLFGDLATKLSILASITNYFVFFGQDSFRNIKYNQKKLSNKKKKDSATAIPMNVCYICGANELTNPEKEFRYCSKCNGRYCYCLEHLQKHEHKN